MKRIVWCLTFMLLVLVACGGNNRPQTETTPPAQNVLPDAAPAGEQGYPAQATPTDAADAPYPPPTQTPLLMGDYPISEGVWVLRPVAEQQCTEDGSAPPKTYPSLSAAVEALEANGIEVSASGTTGLIVCEACTCPTSEHYRVRVNPDDLDAALTLGWTEEE